MSLSQLESDKSQTITKQTALEDNPILPNPSDYPNHVINKITRQVDLRIIPIIFIIYLLCFLDRVNIGFARLYQLEADLKLSPSQYSWTLSIFFVGYILFEIPSNLIIKKATPSRWIARIMVSWGIFTMCLAAANNFSGLMAGRFFLGAAEAGLLPGLVFYLSFWYTRKEQAMRLSLLYTATSVAAIIAGPLAYGISFLHGKAGLSGWQWIFILEGIPSVVVGITTWWLLPNSPADINWLKAEDKKILIDRLSSDHTDVSSTKFYASQFKEAFTDYKVYLYMLTYFGFVCPLYSMAQLLPTIINGMGFNVAATMLLSMPPWVFASIANILVAWSSDRRKDRCFHFVAPLLMSAIGFLTLAFVKDRTSQYVANFFAVAGIASAMPIHLAWLNNNMIGVTKSATASAMVISFGNFGGFISGQMYLKSEAPYFIQSNLICMSLLIISILLSLLLRVLLARENRRFDRNKEGSSNRKIREDGLDLTGFQYIL